jgi:uncharacterized protein (TIGR02647 family)
MPFSQELMEELNILIRFNLDTGQQGIKVHSTADPQWIAATQRLFRKRLITQADGGYLTDLGREVAEHADALLSIMSHN